MLVVPSTGNEVVSFRSDGHRFLQRVGSTLSVVEETGFIVPAEFDIIHIRAFACHPFAIDSPIIVGIGIQEDTAYDVLSTLGSSQLCLRGTEAAECGIAAQA